MARKIKTAIAYIRIQSADKGWHRKACVALQTTRNPDKIRVAWSICHPLDKFSASYARASALGRLKSRSQSKLLTVSKPDEVFSELGMKFNTLYKQHPFKICKVKDTVSEAISDLIQS